MMFHTVDCSLSLIIISKLMKVLKLNQAPLSLAVSLKLLIIYVSMVVMQCRDSLVSHFSIYKLSPRDQIYCGNIHFDDAIR